LSLELCWVGLTRPFHIRGRCFLVEKMPDSLESLLKVDRFGEVKVKKYGESILEILNEINNPGSVDLLIERNNPQN